MKGILGYLQLTIVREDENTIRVVQKDKEDRLIKLDIGDTITIQAPYVVNIVDVEYT